MSNAVNNRSLVHLARHLYDSYGQKKPIGAPATGRDRPHFFLLRRFLSENDLLVIFNTKRCRYRCHFCQLPEKSSPSFVPASAIIEQFRFVIEELKHALSILDRVTLSNEGSVLDADTFPHEALTEVLSAIGEFRRIRRVVFETRLEFVQIDDLVALKHLIPRVTIDVLTGFETVNGFLRDKVLGKHEPLDVFTRGLDRLGAIGAHLTAYVLFKPDPGMTDEEACREADESIDFLRQESTNRSIPLTVRLNPMYLATGSRWARYAEQVSCYQPPQLSDVIALAEKWIERGVKIYIGLSSEGLAASAGSYLAREDYSADLLRRAISLNNRQS